MLYDYCDITWTSTVKNSRQTLEEYQYDLILLDVNLSDGSGLELLEDLDSLIKRPLVVVFSAEEIPDVYTSMVYAVLLKTQTNHFDLIWLIILKTY